MNSVAVIIPSWNSAKRIKECLHSLSAQSIEHTVIVVDNGSVDSSPDIIASSFPDVQLLRQPKNLGFAGGINIGIRHAIKQGFHYVALLNDDATVDKDWLKHLVEVLKKTPKAGAAMSKIISNDKTFLDGTGEVYTSWGIHYPRGRGEKPGSQYDEQTVIFGASGGASLFRVKALEDIGLFDEDFFAYYEDIDLAWRLQLRGWKAVFAPDAIAYHRISVSGNKVKGFTTYQTMKNLPWVVWKNIPGSLLWQILPRFAIAYTSYFWSAVFRGRGWFALKGVLVSLMFLPKKLVQRIRIQRRRTVSTKVLTSLIEWDLPPDQRKLRKLRRLFTGKP